MKVKYYQKERRQFLVRFSYRGDAFFGVQKQPGLKTVLNALAWRIEFISGQYPRALCIASRTDRGVHALENYATFWLKFDNLLNEKHFKDELSGVFEDDLLDLHVWSVHPSVHARGSKYGKRYCYSIIDGCGDDLIDEFSWKVTPHLDVEKMREAAEFFLGIHDFSSFKGQGCQAGSAIKQIYEISCHRKGRKIYIEISGNSFLRKMIRNMVGILIEIGAGLRSSNSIAQILLEKNRKAAGIMAPACGLTLIRIDFDHSTNPIS